MAETLCKTEGSISSFRNIEKGITQSHRILQERTLMDNIKTKQLSSRDRHTSNFTFSNFFVPVVRKLTPLPELNWASAEELWVHMLEKDRKYARDALYLRYHKNLLPRMRSILLDWLIEVRVLIMGLSGGGVGKYSSRLADRGKGLDNRTEWEGGGGGNYAT